MASPVPEEDVRRVYAAADVTLVARHPGTGKESGLVVDAARLGVPLLVSGHDPDAAASIGVPTAASQAAFLIRSRLNTETRK
jgi:hypothetical protein